ncbi:MAG: cation diffusion facilitator family transporter [Methylococcales bacterium]|nr:cation diffusion facilitator family transporter [Methylococcales bacterium]
MSDHHHHHHHGVQNYNKAFALGIMLNSVFVGIEVAYGLSSSSLALLADAGHNLSDVFSLILAWGASLLSKKSASEKRTYGYRKITIIASNISAILLLMTLGGIVWEAIGRFNEPHEVDSLVIIIVAGIGVIINSVTAWLFVQGQKEDLNIKGAFLHMVADAVISLGVVISGLVIMKTDLMIIDPAISILVAIVILISTMSLLKDSFNLAIDAVPENIAISKIKVYFSSLPSVVNLHDLHVWALSTTETALSVHLVVTDEQISNDFLQKIQHDLHAHYHIEHATIQLEKQAENAMLHDPKCS